MEFLTTSLLQAFAAVTHPVPVPNFTMPFLVYVCDNPLGPSEGSYTVSIEHDNKKSVIDMERFYPSKSQIISHARITEVLGYGSDNKPAWFFKFEGDTSGSIAKGVMQFEPQEGIHVLMSIRSPNVNIENLRCSRAPSAPVK